MKKRIGFAITLAAAVLCILPKVAVPQSGQGGNSQGDQAAAIEGTWLLQIAPVGAPAFNALSSFAAGGVTVATGTSDRILPFAPQPTAPISPIIGSLRNLDNNTYISDADFFIFNDSGMAVNLFKNIITYRLTGYNNLTGTGQGFMCDINADHCNPFGSGFTISTIKRIIPGA